MFCKLAFRNVQRSMKDYMVYVLTMTAITAFMYSFGSLFFDTQLSEAVEGAMMMKALLGVATFFIVLIVAWLINYMVRFMLEKRSAEFGIYMLLGMKKKKIANLYMRENFLLGIAAFLPGVAMGIVLQQIIMAILSDMIRVSYHFMLSINSHTLLVTFLCYGGCYFLAMFRCKRKFRKMNIQALMNVKRQNEEIKEAHEHIRRVIFPLSILLIFAFWTIFPRLTDLGAILLFLILLVVDIYLFYMGLSAWIICYIRKRKDGVYKGQNLFLLRQFSSKIRTMQFTMGTLTALFTIALMGGSIAMMFGDFENKLLDSKWPFDVQIYSSDATDEFEDEQEVITQNTKAKQYYIYRIYTDEKSQANTWMYTNLSSFGDMYRNEDGSADTKALSNAWEENGSYCRYDTYMGLTDYNHLRKMVGYKEISLKEDEYAIQIKSRLESDVADMPSDLSVQNASKSGTLTCAGIYSDAFSQDGHNGGDYLLIVPDAVIQTMRPYYSEMAVELAEKTPVGLQKKLDKLSESEAVNAMGHADTTLEGEKEGNSSSGSDNILVHTATNLVRDNLIPEIEFMLSCIIVPGFYMGLVFLCVALTVLSVHQLSDSAKYKSRYDVLDKIGLDRTQINKLIRTQLFTYYICPAMFAMLISGSVILRISRSFIASTGVHTSVFQYFGMTVLLFLGIYLIYFLATYVGFKRNIYSKD